MRLVDNDEYIPVLIGLMEEGKEVSMIVSGSSMNPFLIHHRDSDEKTGWSGPAW